MTDIPLQNKLIEAYLEYFDSESVDDFFALIATDSSLEQTQLEIDALICGIHMAIEGKTKEQELVSKLIRDGTLDSDYLSEECVSQAFNYFLENTDQVFMDNPSEGLVNYSKLLARAIADEVLHPNFIIDHPSYSNDAPHFVVGDQLTAASLLNYAFGMLTASHGMVRLDYIWENYSCYCGNKSSAVCDKKFRNCIREFLDSHDFWEVKKEINESDAPHLKNTWAYHLILQFLDEKAHLARPNEENCNWLLKLLHSLLSEGHISQENINNAIQKVHNEMVEEDYPNFSDSFKCLENAIKSM